MNVEKDIDTRKLYQRIAHLEENRRFIQNALEMALSLGDFQRNIDNGYGSVKILQEADARVQQLFPFDATALYLVDEDKSDFKLGISFPQICAPCYRNQFAYTGIVCWIIGR
jgi:hypothetical protein